MQAIRNAETLGFIALLIPVTGIATMVATEAIACTYNFDCTREYPTLSYAATFSLEGRVFTPGMCLTALFILATSVLFYWFLYLKLALGSSSARGGGSTLLVSTSGAYSSDAPTHVTALVCLVAGIATAVTLTGLAVFGMRTHHDAHIAFTVAFFVASWILIVSCHLARRLVLKHEALSNRQHPAPSWWLGLRHWRRLSLPMAFALGRVCILVGIASTVLFGLLFLCVNGSWSNPFGFTAVQEAFFEALAIVCQLLFMGTLSCELSLLAREVETHDYMKLERRE